MKFHVLNSLGLFLTPARTWAANSSRAWEMLPEQAITAMRSYPNTFAVAIENKGRRAVRVSGRAA